MRIILASKSPRRRELLGGLADKLGFEFEIITRETDEELDASVHPKDGVEILAVRKGAAVAELLSDEELVISSDTLVELDGVALGKPTDKKDAERMLSMLSDREHNVHTGIAVHYRGRVYSGVASTAVRFIKITGEEMDKYIESGEPMDKAGAYGIQGYAGRFVSSVRGDIDTVIGMSMTLTEKLIRQATDYFDGDSRNDKS